MTPIKVPTKPSFLSFRIGATKCSLQFGHLYHGNSHGPAAHLQCQFGAPVPKFYRLCNLMTPKQKQNPHENPCWWCVMCSMMLIFSWQNFWFCKSWRSKQKPRCIGTDRCEIDAEILYQSLCWLTFSLSSFPGIVREKNAPWHPDHPAIGLWIKLEKWHWGDSFQNVVVFKHL